MTDTLTTATDRESHAFELPVAQELYFARPLVGFPSCLRFRLEPLAEKYAPFMALRSVDSPGLDFVVVAPGLVFNDYVFEVGDEDADLLGVGSAADVAVLVLVTRRPDAIPTANLMGPIVVNARTGRAAQLVLQDGGYGAAVRLDAGSARTDAA